MPLDRAECFPIGFCRPCVLLRPDGAVLPTIRRAGSFPTGQSRQGPSTLGARYAWLSIHPVHSQRSACIVSGFEDKIRTRSYLHFLIFINFCIFLFIFLQPAHCMDLLSLLLIGVSILVGHLFVLTNSKAANLFFIGSMTGLILLFCFNVWTLL